MTPFKFDSLNKQQFDNLHCLGLPCRNLGIWTSTCLLDSKKGCDVLWIKNDAVTLRDIASIGKWEYWGG